MPGHNALAMSRDPEAPAIEHRIARIHGEVQQSQFKLVRIYAQSPQDRLKLGRDLGGRSDRAANISIMPATRLTTSTASGAILVDRLGQGGHLAHRLDPVAQDHRRCPRARSSS